MNFKKWVKSIQTLGYNDARTVDFFGRQDNPGGSHITAVQPLRLPQFILQDPG
jgi:hypothetical protein